MFYTVVVDGAAVWRLTEDQKIASKFVVMKVLSRISGFSTFSGILIWNPCFRNFMAVFRN
jgi:hypothetical protein